MNFIALPKHKRQNKRGCDSRKSQHEIDDEKDVQKQINELYGDLAIREIDGYNSPADRKIADNVVGQWFSKYPNKIKKEIKENCILELWAKRSQFRADGGASYHTWGVTVCRNAMLN